MESKFASLMSYLTRTLMGDSKITKIITMIQ